MSLIKNISGRAPQAPLQVLLGALALMAIGLSGCFTTNVGPTAAEQFKADSVAAAGTETLDEVFDDLTSDQFEYGNEDLTELNEGNAAFRQALKLDPENNEARFGAAVTSVLLALQSQKLSDLLNRTAEAESPFDINLGKNFAAKRTALLRGLNNEEVPEVHELQDAVADTLLPVLESAISQLQAVYNDPAFSITLTLDGEEKELDHGEVTVLLAGFKTLHALSTLVLSYDLDFDDNGSYDYLEVIGEIGDIEDFSALTDEQSDALKTLTNLFKMDAPLLAVRPAWKSKLANVDNEIIDALAILRTGLGTLATETDSQNDDILRLCSLSNSGIHSDCINRSDYNEGLKELDTLSKYMKQPYPVSIADTTVKVNFAAFFNVQDYKKMWPYYGFYAPVEWSEEKPVFYFANSSGTKTGNVKTLGDMLDRADEHNWPNKKLVDSLKLVIKWRDPTFQGFLPGTTESSLWTLILKLANEGEGPLGKQIATSEGKRRFSGSLLHPKFALTLLGND